MVVVLVEQVGFVELEAAIPAQSVIAAIVEVESVGRVVVDFVEVGQNSATSSFGVGLD